MEEIKKKVETIFETGKNQVEILDGIYGLLARQAVPGFIADRPFCGKRLYRFIAQKFQTYDYQHFPKAFPGGLWFTKGFRESKLLDDWEVDGVKHLDEIDSSYCFD